jgi:hypothetical protein
MGNYMGSNVEAALLPPTASLGIKTPSPQRSSAFEVPDLNPNATASVNNALMSRLMEMIHLPSQPAGHGTGPGGINGDCPEHVSQPESSLRMDCELTGTELNNIKSRLAHEVASGNSSTGIRSPGAQGRGHSVPPFSSAPSAAAPTMQMSSPFGAASMQRNASSNMGVSTPDQPGEHKFLGCPS